MIELDIGRMVNAISLPLNIYLTLHPAHLGTNSDQYTLSERHQNQSLNSKRSHLIDSERALKLFDLKVELCLKSHSLNSDAGRQDPPNGSVLGGPN